MEMKDPQHPGVFLADELIGPLSLSVTGAARILGIGRPAVERVAQWTRGDVG